MPRPIDRIEFDRKSTLVEEDHDGIERLIRNQAEAGASRRIFVRARLNLWPICWMQIEFLPSE